MATIKDGEAFVGPRSQEKAAELLDLADKAGLDQSVVRATLGGYIVPASLLDRAEEPKKTRQRRTTKETDQ